MLRCRRRRWVAVARLPGAAPEVGPQVCGLRAWLDGVPLHAHGLGYALGVLDVCAYYDALLGDAEA
eukprot:9358230-Pyramimonas_sp.AAC.1